MARPKLGESESRRLQMVITDDELKAIEDWQFDNRVPSKSEAIRRLCQIAVGMDEILDEATEFSTAIVREARAEWEIALDALKAFPTREGEEFEELRRRLSTSYNIFEAADKLNLLLVSSYNRIVPLVDEANVKKALRASSDEAARAQVAFDEINQREEQYAENNIIAEVSMSWTPEERATYEALSEDDKDVWWRTTISSRMPDELKRRKFKR